MSIMPNEVASLIIPLEKYNLLVPNASVAEIVPHVDTEKTEDSPEWVAGNIVWRNLSLPCISYEKLIGQLEGNIAEGDRIAIFNTVSDSFGKRFYGMSISGIPRLARVIETEIVEEEAEKSVFEKMHVKVNGEACIIPDLEAIEKLLGSALS